MIELEWVEKIWIISDCNVHNILIHSGEIKNAHIKYTPLKFCVNWNFVLCNANDFSCIFCTLVFKKIGLRHLHTHSILNQPTYPLQNAFIINVILLYFKTMKKTLALLIAKALFSDHSKKNMTEGFVLRWTWQHFCPFPVNLVPFPLVNGRVF